MHTYYLRNRILMFLFHERKFRCRKEKLSLYFTFFPYVLVILYLIFWPHVCWKMEKLFMCLSDSYSMKRSYIWPWMVTVENPVGETLLQQNFCIHSEFINCNIQCYTFLCALCIFIILSGCHNINTSSGFIKLDYQFITKDIIPSKWKGSIGQGMWKRVQSFHVLFRDASLLASLPSPCIQQLEAVHITFEIPFLLHICLKHKGKT